MSGGLKFQHKITSKRFYVKILNSKILYSIDKR